MASPHLSPFGLLGGALKGTFPNPGFNAQNDAELMIARSAFGPRNAAAAIATAQADTDLTIARAVFAPRGPSSGGSGTTGPTGPTGPGSGSSGSSYVMEDDFDLIPVKLSDTARRFDWQTTVSGTGAQFIYPNGEQNHPGIQQLQSGTTAAGSCEAYLGISGSTLQQYFLEATDGLFAGVLVRFPTVPSTTEGFGFAFGLRDSNSYNERVSIGVRGDNVSAPYWRCITTHSTTATTTDTVTGGTPTSGTWYWLSFVAKTGSVLFYVNGTLIATHTTNIPTAGSTGMNVYMTLLKNVGTTNRNADVDYYRIKKTFSTPRFTDSP
jgi:hypothetical protein